MSFYPRQTEDGKLVTDRQMVGCREHLYSQHRITLLTGEITGEVATTDSLFAFDSLGHEPIKIIITSPGGQLDPALLLCDTFRLLQSPVYTVGRFCCSAAVLLLAAGTKRYLFPHARVMLHLPSAQLWGDTRDLSVQHREVQRAQDMMVGLLQEYGVKKTKDEILLDIDREKWMGAEEAIAYGLADEILTPKTMKEWLL